MEQNKILNFFEWLNKEMPLEELEEIKAQTMADFERGHSGDCTGENYSCGLCLLERDMDRYFFYVKQTIKR